MTRKQELMIKTSLLNNELIKLQEKFLREKNENAKKVLNFQIGLLLEQIDNLHKEVN